jgi:4-phosphopantoate--beta-alanine ligase
VNLFHRTKDRIEKITRLLEAGGAEVSSGRAEPLLPLPHDRAWVRREGMYAADVVLVPLEDGDRCEALVRMGKNVIAVDLNPLSRTARAATVTIVDELTRALPNITAACRDLTQEERGKLIASLNNRKFLKEAMEEMERRLVHALD